MNKLGGYVLRFYKDRGTNAAATGHQPNDRLKLIGRVDKVVRSDEKNGV